MASEMNGQSFTFHICLLKRRKKASFKTLERISFEKTNPKFSLKLHTETINYWNLIQTLHPETHLCIATDYLYLTE
jgi:16S rRNA (cytidine1402-2'-O)-methyltransferase